MPPRIRAASDDNAAIHSKARPIAERLRELADGFPVRIRFAQKVNPVVPDLGATLPRIRLWEIRTASDDQACVQDTGKRRGDAAGIWDIREAAKLQKGFHFAVDVSVPQAACRRTALASDAPTESIQHSPGLSAKTSRK